MLHLEQPLTIKGMELHTRLVMPPMATGKATADGGISDATVTYFPSGPLPISQGDPSLRWVYQIIKEF